MSQVQAALPLVLLLLVAYLLLIRPTRKRARATALLQSALSPGDEVMLSSGLFATVKDVQDEIATVELAPDVVVRVHRGAVTQIIVERPSEDGEVPPEDEEPARGDNPGVS